MTRLRLLFLAPSAVLLAVLLAAPIAIVAVSSALTRGTYGGLGLPWTIENYARLLDPLYAWILLRSAALAGAATLLCLLVGFPMALFLTRAGRRRNLCLCLVMLPFWTSFLVRTYAWMFLLRDTGLVNTVLQSVGLIRDPLPLLYNDGAVVLGLVYGYLPFMILPIYAALERLDPSLAEASADLGARPWTTVTLVLAPLAWPGILAGCLLVFIPCLGAYLTPDLLGGGKSVMVGNLVQNQFTNARDWPFGSAVSVALLALVMLLLLTLLRRRAEELL